MQINTKLNTNETKWMTLIRWLVFMACVGFIARSIAHQPSFDLVDVWAATNIGLVLLATLLMPLNWYLEVLKWQIAVPSENLSLMDASRRVLHGLALNWVLPFTLGDAGARLHQVKNRKESVHALIVTRSLMLILTAIFGVVSWLFYLHWFTPPEAVMLLALAIIILAIIVRLMYGKRIHVVYLLSVSRYAIFTVQFLLVLFALTDFPIDILFFGVGWVFLFRSFIPSLFGNFGVREASALIYFEQYAASASGIILACLIIWAINTVIPSLFGALSLLQVRQKLVG